MKLPNSHSQDSTELGISVLLPTNKVNDWLDFSIVSLLESIEVQFEVILILDGVSVTEHREWMNDTRIKIIQIKESKGLPHALNLGISHSKYPIISRLDGDDLISKERLSKQLDYLISNPNVSAVGCRVMLIDEKGNEIGELIAAPLNQDIRKKMLLRNVVAHPALAFRKSCIEQIGTYNEQMTQMEDYEFILRLAMCGEVHNIDYIGLFYRVHTNQMSRSFNSKNSNLKQVAVAKKSLARQIKVSSLHVMLLIGIWKFAEFTRSIGLRKPRYQKMSISN